MSRFPLCSSSVVLSLFLTVELLTLGCAKKAPSQGLSQSNPDAQSESTIAPKENASDTNRASATSSESLADTTKPTLTSENKAENEIPRPQRDARPLDEAKFIVSDAFGLIVIHPRQISESPLGQILSENQKQFDLLKDISSALAKMKLQPSDIDRAIMVLDQASINVAAAKLGITPPIVAKADTNEMAIKTRLQNLGLAFHNYHDMYRRFPRANGDAEGNQTGLSWRVHLLPLLQENALYEEFHLDEAWDSDHNKSLIARMPRAFQTDDVTEEGKTAFRVFSGENTPFHGEKGTGIPEITDGLSNTIFVVKFNPEFADVWTKPDGFNPSDVVPKQSFEVFNDEHFLALMMDGAVIKIPSTVDDVTMAHLIQRNDGHPVDLRNVPKPASPAVSPTLVLTMAREFEPKDFVSTLIDSPTEIMEGDQKIYLNKMKAITFPNPQTAVVGHPQAVRRIVSSQSDQQGNRSALLEQLQLTADVTYAIDLKSQSTIVNQLVQLTPMLGILANVTTVSGQFSLNANAGDPAAEVQAVAVDEQMAAGVNAVATMALNATKKKFEQQKLPDQANASDREMSELTKKLVSTATLKLDGKKVRFIIPTPNGMARIVELLKSGLQKN